MFKKILIVLIISTIIIADDTIKQLTSPEETIVLLNELKEDAIVLGEGPIDVHTFIDPYCSVSQYYVKHLFKNQARLFKKYTIHLYLYELKRKKSAKVIRNLYHSEPLIPVLKEVMLHKSDINLEEIDDDEIEDKIENIETCAKAIGVYKRPYIITNGKGL